MYYWHLTLIPQDFENQVEWYTWSDSYERAKVNTLLIYGVRTKVLSCVRVENP